MKNSENTIDLASPLTPEDRSQRHYEHDGDQQSQGSMLVQSSQLYIGGGGIVEEVCNRTSDLKPKLQERHDSIANVESKPSAEAGVQPTRRPKAPKYASFGITMDSVHAIRPIRSSVTNRANTCTT